MDIQKTAALALRAITANEIGGDLSLAYKFSDADGLRTGKSGYSFGRCQFDIENNWTALDCLRDCGFRPADMKLLYSQTHSISELSRKLKANAETVDRYDRHQATEAVDYCHHLLERTHVTLLDEETLLHVVDYHNQLYLSDGGKLHTHMMGLGRVVEPKDIFAFKMNSTLWGSKRPDDVVRRFDNIKGLIR